MGDVALTDGTVQLRAWDESDAPWYARTAAGDELIQRHSTESPEVTAEQVRAAIVELAGRGDAAGYLIADAATGERLGNIAAELVGDVAHLSYWLAAPARGRGVATRAVVLFARWLFASHPLTALQLWVRDENAASQAVALRAGFVRDPDLDERRAVKGQVWQMLGYRLPAPPRE